LISLIRKTAARAPWVLLATIRNYTLSFVMEEQAVFPKPGERSPLYSIDDRIARLDPAMFPYHRQASSIMFDRYDRRFREGLELILNGAKCAASAEVSRLSKGK
jgi:TetR/AcrR family tetracycline transcriptional repressor